MKRLTAFLTAAAIAAANIVSAIAAEPTSTGTGQVTSTAQSTTTTEPEVTPTPESTETPTPEPSQAATPTMTPAPMPVYIIKNGNGSNILLTYKNNKLSAERMISDTNNTAVSLLNIDGSNYVPFRYLFEKFGLVSVNDDDDNKYNVVEESEEYTLGEVDLAGFIASRNGDESKEKDVSGAYAWQQVGNDTKGYKVCIRVLTADGDLYNLVQDKTIEGLKNDNGETIDLPVKYENYSTYLPLRALQLINLDTVYDAENDAIFIYQSIDEVKKAVEGPKKQLDAAKDARDEKNAAYNKLDAELHAKQQSDTSPNEDSTQLLEDLKKKVANAQKESETANKAVDAAEKAVKEAQANADKMVKVIEDAVADAKKAYKSQFNDNYATYSYIYNTYSEEKPSAVLADGNELCYGVNQYGNMLLYINSKSQIHVCWVDDKGKKTEEDYSVAAENGEAFIVDKIAYDGRKIYGIRLNDANDPAGRIFSAALAMNVEGEGENQKITFFLKNIKYLEGVNARYMLLKTIKTKNNEGKDIYNRYLYFIDYDDSEKIKRIGIDDLSGTPIAVSDENNGELTKISHFDITDNYIIYNNYIEKKVTIAMLTEGDTPKVNKMDERYADDVNGMISNSNAGANDNKFYFIRDDGDSNTVVGVNVSDDKSNFTDWTKIEDVAGSVKIRNIALIGNKLYGRINDGAYEEISQ